MALFILFVAILDLALGYGLALYLHGETEIWPGGWSFATGLKKFHPFGKEPDDGTDDALRNGAANRDTAPAASSPTAAASLTASMSRVTNPSAIPSADDELDERLVIDQHVATQ